MWVGAMSGALGIKEGRSISYARVVQTPLLCALDGGFLVVKPLHLIVSDPYPIRFMTRLPLEATNRSNLGLHLFENRHRNPRRTRLKRLLRRIPTHITDYSHWLRGWDSRDHLLGNGLVVFQTRPGRAGLLALTHVHSSNCHGGRDTRKEHAFRYLKANLRRRRYTPIPLNIPEMGGPSISHTFLAWRKGTGPIISILRP